MRVLGIGLCALIVGLSGCATPEERAAQRAEAEAKEAAEIAVRQGERVNRICFNRSVNGWREFGRKSLLLRRGVNEWYKLDLAGTCDPEWAFNAIGVRTFPGSSCISRGDDIVTRDAGFTGTCKIMAIYEWDEEAEFSWAPEE